MKELVFRLLIAFCLISIWAEAQNNTDSLENLFKSENNNTKKAEYAAKLVIEVYKSKGDLSASRKYFSFVNEHADKKQRNKNTYADALKNMGVVFYYIDKIDSALLLLNQSKDLAGKYEDHWVECKAINNIASMHYSQGELKTALEMYIQGAKKEKEYGFEEGEHISMNNIGYIYKSMRIPEKAMYYFRKGLAYAQKRDNKSSMIYSYDGLSNSFPDHSDSSTYYTFKCYQLANEINDLNNIMYSSNEIANYYYHKNDYPNALRYANECLQLANKLENRVAKAYAFNIYLSVALKQKDYVRSGAYCDSAKKYINDKVSRYTLNQLYRSIANQYYETKKLDSAFVYLRKAYLLNDSLYKSEISATIADLQTKYDFQKKEDEIQTLNKTNKQKQIIIYVSIVIAIIILLLAVNTLVISKKRKKLNIELNDTNKKIEEKNHLIEEKQKEILDSIHYAKRIQTALLAHKEFIDQNIPGNFVYFNPKDIVSGDFYWATKHGDLFFLAVCDSTGHGVPGAFMSLLNIGFMSEAINEKDIIEPNKVFNYVRKRLIDSISKDGQKDGFDGILLCINLSNKKMTYAAAHNAPVIAGPAGLRSLETDKMPVGMGIHENEFRLFDLELRSGETLYLYTDGYADQFGGPKGKKFKYKQLNDLIVSIHEKEMPEQMEILQAEFENWKGKLEQVDDVCVIGIRT